MTLVTGFAVIQLHPDLFGLVLLTKELEADTWFKPVHEQLPHALIFLIGLMLSYLLTSETGIRSVLAFFPGALVAAVVYLPFGWSNLGIAFSMGLGLFTWITFHKRLCNSTWIGTRCRKCSKRGTIKEKLVKRKVLGINKTRNENGITEKHEIYRRTIRYSCRFCGLAWTEVSEGTSEVFD